MKYQYKSIFILIIICLLAYHAHSQHISDNVKQRNYHEDQYFELNQPSAGNQTYVARDYIKLEPGFSYTAQNSESFNGYTNPLLVFPPTQGEYGGPDADDDGIVGTIPGSYAVTQTQTSGYYTKLNFKSPN